jgi:ankyrin repeat protein
LENNPEYVFEIEFNGKTPICYAACHNQTEIGKLILEVGVNSDHLCANGHTALYYAVCKGNTELVRELLQKGSCPWSTPKNPYSWAI